MNTLVRVRRLGSRHFLSCNRAAISIVFSSSAAKELIRRSAPFLLTVLF